MLITARNSRYGEDETCVRVGMRRPLQAQVLTVRASISVLEVEGRDPGSQTRKLRLRRPDVVRMRNAAETPTVAAMKSAELVKEMSYPATSSGRIFEI